MAKEIMEKHSNGKRLPAAMVGTARRRNGKPKDRITAKVLAAEAAGYGPHYGQFVADHPDAFKNWEPGQDVPKVETSLMELTCRFCGKTFKTRQPNRRYCDDVCRARQASADYRAKKAKQEENAK
ncbi:MAG: hypothetical protein IKY92_03770 [Akkermansia sp.]|nr:hypothetical protein [Akkermansia sp.]